MSTTITLTIRALDLVTAYTGTANYGVFLKPGEHAPGAAVTVTVGGSEVSAYVEDLHGRHPDGTVVAILVQHAVTIAGAGSVSAAVILGQTPTMGPMTQDAAARRTQPAVTALPDKVRACAAWPLWSMAPSGTTSSVPAVNAANVTLERVMKGIAKRPYNGTPTLTWSPTGRGNGGDKYDGALATLHAGVRFGGTDSFQWGHYFLGDGITQASSAEAAVRAGGYVPTEFSFNNSADYWAHAYWLTGAELYRTCAAALANRWRVNDLTSTYLADQGLDARRCSKWPAAALCALATEASYGGVDYGPAGYSDVISGPTGLRPFFTKMIQQQRPANDSFSNPGQPNDYIASGPGASIGGGWWTYGPNLPVLDGAGNPQLSKDSGTYEGDRYKIENYMVAMLTYETCRAVDWLDARGLIPPGEVAAVVGMASRARAWMNTQIYTPLPNYPPGPHYEIFRDGTFSATTGDVSWFPVTWPWLFYAWLERRGVTGAIADAQTQYVALVGQMADVISVNVDTTPYGYSDWIFPTGGGRGDWDIVTLNGVFSQILPLASDMTVGPPPAPPFPGNPAAYSARPPGIPLVLCQPT